MTRFATFVLVLSGLGFLGFGLAFLFDPLGVLAAIDLTVSGPGAATEIRAFYGGLEIALGIALLAAVRTHRREGLALAALAYGTIGLVRALGLLLLDREPTTFLWLALATEVLLAGAAAMAWRGTRPR